MNMIRVFNSKHQMCTSCVMRGRCCRARRSGNLPSPQA